MDTSKYEKNMWSDTSFWLTFLPAVGAVVITYFVAKSQYDDKLKANEQKANADLH